MRGKILWPYVITFAVVHAVALLAFMPWLFSWTGLIVCVAGVFFFGQAINLCYHRVLTHKSCRLPKWLEHAYVVLALCCLQDTPAKWVATHRYHHLHSDHRDDPHTPLVTFLWAHIGWLCVWNTKTHALSTYAKYAPDILKDRFYMNLEKRRRWLGWVILHAVAFAAMGAGIGLATEGTAVEAGRMAASLLVWGVFVRIVAVWHITWSVNSVSHVFGYQNYEDTDDHSKNNWLVALLAVGEGWHNNHHADPVSASNQHRWWEIDLTYWNIKLLEKMGLATKVMKPKHVRHAGRDDRDRSVKGAEENPAQTAPGSGRDVA